MNKFDKYYLKEGRLELSILDEENLDEQELIVGAKPEPSIKMSKEIYNTLQTMGKFLTNKETDEELVEKKDEDPNKLKATQARQLEEAVNAMYQKVIKDCEKISISPKMVSTKKDHKELEVANEKVEERILTQEPIHKPMQIAIFEDEEIDDRQLEQESIDKILVDYFGEAMPKHVEAKRLKAYIDEKIEFIRNYS